MFRKTTIVAISIFILVILAFGKTIPPKKSSGKVSLSFDGKKYDYWISEPDKVVEYELSGPLTTKIYIRAESKTKPQVKIKMNGEEVKTLTVENGISQQSKVKGFNKITKAETVMIKIPRGKHILTIESDKRIIVRLHSKQKKQNITLAPQRHDGGMVLVSDEEEYGYYRCSKNKGVQYVLLGKGTITIYTRLIFSPGMMGTQHYTLNIQIDDEKPVLYEFETEASSVSYFENDKKIIPGKAQKVNLKIPKGKHTVSITTEDSQPIAVRLTLPMSMIKNK